VSEITIYTAKKIITMDDSQPEATAVAVREGLILEVGTLESLKPWMEEHPYRIDDEFSGKVVMPGFIDPHQHPTMAAMMLQMEFICAMEWRLPWGTVDPVVGKDAFLERVAELDKNMEDPTEPLFIWGYHFLWHGHIRRPDLDKISTTRPIIVWFRSFHEMMMNEPALERFNLTPDSIGSSPQADLINGHFYEAGYVIALNSGVLDYLLDEERYRLGMERLIQVMRFGGHTAIGDMAVGLFDLEKEIEMTYKVMGDESIPFRMMMVPSPFVLLATEGNADKACEVISELSKHNTDKIQFRDHVKMFADGAMFSQLAMLKEPGYIDGHHGEWMMPPETFESVARTFWHQGYRIHVHTVGDLGLEMVIDTLAKLQNEFPRADHGFTIEHFCMSTPEQVKRLAELGAHVSATVQYAYELSGMYSRKGVGYERASQFARIGECRRQGITVALHSDYGISPALPLNTAWVASNRINIEGDLIAPSERLSLDDALKAITINAAVVMNMQDEIGSIRSGKKADFTILDDDPYKVGVEQLKDIGIWGTVFEGKKYPLKECQ